MHIGRKSNRQSRYPLPFGYSLSALFGYFADDDSSDTSLLSLSIDSCSMGTRLSFQLYHLFAPLYGLMTSRYRRGDAVTPAPGEKDLHLHDYQVVKVRISIFPCHPSLRINSFRMNESHPLAAINRRRFRHYLLTEQMCALTSSMF